MGWLQESSSFLSVREKSTETGDHRIFLIFINMRKIDQKQFSFPLFENDRNQIINKFCIKFMENFDWIILNKIFIEFKFVEHLRKILKTLLYFLVQFELISSIEVWICDCAYSLEFTFASAGSIMIIAMASTLWAKILEVGMRVSRFLCNQCRFWCRQA